MKKKDLLKTVTFASAILAAGAISFSGVEASADTLDTTPTTANETETTTTNQVTEEQVAAAKAEASAIGDAVKHQETVVADALTTKQSAQAVEAAQTELVAAQETAEAATPEAIQAVEAEIVEAETTVSETEALLETANQEASTAQTQADQAQAVADTANTAYTEAQAQADAAQETVAQLESQTVDVDQAQATVDTTKQEVVTAKANVAAAEQEVVEAEAKDQTLVQEIADAKTAVDEAKVAESNAQTTVVGLEAQVADTASKVTEAQAVVDSLQNEVSYTIDINLPQEVKDAVKKFMSTTPTLESVEELRRVIGSSDFAINYDNYWKIDVTGGEELVDLNNLTNKQVELLNQVIVDMYNKLAENIGLTTVTANSKMIELAKVRSEKYDEADSPQGHNHTILRESENEVFTSPFISAGENLAYQLVASPKITMTELLTNVKSNLMGFTVFDSGRAYGHWRLMETNERVGVYLHVEETDRTTILNKTFEKTWLVMALYKDLPTINGLAKDAVEANAEVHAADVTFESNSIALANANTQLEKALLDESQAKEDLAQAVTVLNQAKADVVSATNAYNTLLSTESETTKAQANLDAANTKLSEAQAKYEQAVDALDALTAQKAEQAQKLATAKTVLDQAQTKATSLYSDYRAKQAQADVLKTKVNQLNQEVQNLETDLANAKQAVVDAKAKLLGLQEAEPNLVKAQEAYDKAVKAKDEACAVYQTELAKLTDLKNSFTLAANHYLTLSNLYKLQEQVKTPTEVTGDNQGTGSSTGSSTSGQNQNGTTVVTKGNSQAPLVQLDKPSAVKATAEASASKGQVKYLDVANAPVQAASLPQTGSNESILSSLAGFTVLGLGLSLAIKRRKYTEE
jgi:SEC10/PgrA surface exclusion-like protein/LPXTG-motif cell wall-anchored protein